MVAFHGMVISIQCDVLVVVRTYIDCPVWLPSSVCIIEEYDIIQCNTKSKSRAQNWVSDLHYYPWPLILLNIFSLLLTALYANWKRHFVTRHFNSILHALNTCETIALSYLPYSIKKKQSLIVRTNNQGSNYNEIRSYGFKI